VTGSPGHARLRVRGEHGADAATSGIDRAVLEDYLADLQANMGSGRQRADGRVPVSGHTYRPVLYRWLEDCDIRDEHGRPVHLTPHQWRHILGTSSATSPSTSSRRSSTTTNLR
jgi:integrase